MSLTPLTERLAALGAEVNIDIYEKPFPVTVWLDGVELGGGRSVAEAMRFAEATINRYVAGTLLPGDRERLTSYQRDRICAQLNAIGLRP